ncbi:MAG TPA: hypothetical protein VF530_12235 [Planctomycetota bacterium]
MRPTQILLATLLAAPLSAAGDGAKAYTFRTPPANSGGLKSLEHLRGKPVLIDFWGTR